MYNEDYPDVDAFLAHHGVKGMKWGERRAQAKAAKSADRAKNLTSARKDANDVFAAAAKEKNPVIAARMKYYSGAGKQKVKDAKAQYPADKIEKGSREAKLILRAAKREYRQDWAKSQELADGKELAESIMADVFGRTDAYTWERHLRNINQYGRGARG